MADTTRRGNRDAGSGSRARTDGGRTAASGRDPFAGAEGDGSPPPGGAPLCSVAFCPICMMVTVMGDARPELMEHLLLAGREMLLAARAVIDARLETMDRDQKGSKLERISIE